ncbi:hypothetical protein KRMM14A1259_08700 [Krasilnikovia sp. MM14-A1259]
MAANEGGLHDGPADETGTSQHEQSHPATMPVAAARGKICSLSAESLTAKPARGAAQPAARCASTASTTSA